MKNTLQTTQNKTNQKVPYWPHLPIITDGNQSYSFYANNSKQR